MAFQINLQDPDLFGKLAAEDEEESIFSSYQLERPELPRLTSEELNNNLVVVSAFRGEGKSALLRMAMKELKGGGKVFVTRTTATSITVDKSSPDIGLGDSPNF